MAQRGRPKKDKSQPVEFSYPLDFLNFDKLPDSAFVRLPTVILLFGGISHSAIWRSAKSGAIPAPKKLTENTSAWNVGELRAHFNKVKTETSQKSTENDLVDDNPYSLP